MAAEQPAKAAVLERTVEFGADGLRVKSAVDLTGLATEVPNDVRSTMHPKRGAHVSRGVCEAELAKMWLSPIAHRWVRYRKLGPRVPSQLETLRACVAVRRLLGPLVIVLMVALGGPEATSLLDLGGHLEAFFDEDPDQLAHGLPLRVVGDKHS